MKKSPLIFGLLLLATTGFAQKDKVYLNNGSLMVGTVTMNASNDSLKVKMYNQTVLLAFSEVDEVKIRKEGFRANYTNKCSFSRGYAGGLKIGALVGGGPNESKASTLGFSTYHGFQFSPLINISVGTGLNQYREYNSVPVFLRYHALMGRARLAPYIYVEGGYGFVKGRNDWSQVSSGGEFYSVGGGIQKKIGSNYLRIEGGVQIQSMEEKLPQFGIWSWPGADNTIIQKRDLTRAVISLSYVW